MTDVTVIGLGPMGSALARALVGAGHAVTVWNRSPAKMRPLCDLGARAANDLPDALRASPIAIVCVDNYDSTRGLFACDAVEPALTGRTIVQLSTGTPAEARELDNWMQARGVQYLDGAIMGYPEHIGQPHARILVAGPEPSFQNCRRFLECLAGDVRYLGTNITAAATLDMALLTRSLCNRIGAIYGALLCKSADVDVTALASMFPGDVVLGEIFERIGAARYDEPGATITVWNGALTRIRQQAGVARIAGDVPEFVAGLFDRAIASGYGDQDIAALFKVLRGTARD